MLYKITLLLIIVKKITVSGFSDRIGLITLFPNITRANG